MTRERDYSMMITKQPEWTRSRTSLNKGNTNAHTRFKGIPVKVINTLTKESISFTNGNVADRHFKWCNGRASFAARKGGMIQYKYIVEFA